MNLAGKIAMSKSNDKTTIGFHYIDIDNDTIEGATIIPSKLIA
jgi:hypothetical protein